MKFRRAIQFFLISAEFMSRRLGIFLIVICGLVTFSLMVSRNNTSRRQSVAALGQTRFNIGVLRTWILRAAELYPVEFNSVMQTNAVLEATSLPDEVLTTFPEGNRSGFLTDVWGRSFHLIVTLKPGAEQTNRHPCELFIWSDGPNAVNENGKGDDISNTTTNRSTN
ncbi:MAG: hypothetical protein HOP33_12270 [Verrucomicrobia bacterium]|nr:hypothetical protein [Verrucomicrobiota bacterium]